MVEELREPASAHAVTATSYNWQWSKTRLHTAVAATRPFRAWTSVDGLMRDEIEFFAQSGRWHQASRGQTLVRHGTHTREVHLIQRGAVAVLGEAGVRRPILAFTMPNELCCPVPVLLSEPAPWDAVAITDSSVLSVPADRFSAAVRERWSDRWGTRTLSWLAAVGARLADLEPDDLTGQAAALVLRLNGDMAIALCRKTIAGLLDIDEDTAARILTSFEKSGAVRTSGGRVAVERAGILRATVAAMRHPGDTTAAPNPPA